MRQTLSRVCCLAGARAPGRRDALLTQLARRAPAWRALFLSVLFALVTAWASFMLLVAAPSAAPAGQCTAWAPLLSGAAPAWLAQLRAALLRAVVMK